MCPISVTTARNQRYPQVHVSDIHTSTQVQPWSLLQTMQPFQDLSSRPCLFPTCQVRVVRFYVSCLLLLPLLLLLVLLLLLLLLLVLLVLVLSSSSSSSCDLRSTAFPAGPQPRSSTPSVPCRTSTATIHAQCSLPDLNHDHPRPVFPAGPQPRPSTPSVPCRTSTASIHAQCSLPDLNRDFQIAVGTADP